MHILLFGASGHIGTGLAEHLGPAHDLTGVVRSTPTGPTPYAPLILPDWVDRPEVVVDALERLGHPVDAVVAAIGGWYIDGDMLARGIGPFDADYAAYLRGHFAACRISEALAEVARRDPLVHLALNGVASIEACVGSGAISVFGAAQEMLIRVAAAETDSVVFRELKILAPVAGDERNDLSGGDRTLSIEDLVGRVTEMLSDPEAHELITTLSAPDPLGGS